MEKEQQDLGLLTTETDIRTLTGKVNMCPTKCPRLESKKEIHTNSYASIIIQNCCLKCCISIFKHI